MIHHQGDPSEDLPGAWRSQRDSKDGKEVRVTDVFLMNDRRGWGADSCVKRELVGEKRSTPPTDLISETTEQEDTQHHAGLAQRPTEEVNAEAAALKRIDFFAALVLQFLL